MIRLLITSVDFIIIIIIVTGNDSYASREQTPRHVTDRSSPRDEQSGEFYSFSNEGKKLISS